MRVVPFAVCTVIGLVSIKRTEVSVLTKGGVAALSAFNGPLPLLSASGL